MLRVQVSLPPSSHSAIFFFPSARQTLGAFENFAVEVPSPAASFKLFITSGRLGHQLNTRVKQNAFKVYSLGAAVVFPTCSNSKRVLDELPLPFVESWHCGFFFSGKSLELERLRPSWIRWAHVNSLIVAFGQNQFVYLVFKCDTSHV